VGKVVVVGESGRVPGVVDTLRAGRRLDVVTKRLRVVIGAVGDVGEVARADLVRLLLLRLCIVIIVGFLRYGIEEDIVSRVWGRDGGPEGLVELLDGDMRMATMKFVENLRCKQS
jgi:hypothetical protein